MNFLNQSSRTALFIGMAAAVTLGGFIASAQAQEKIKIGTLLSASGPAAAAGRSSVIGVRIAVDEINRSGGILGRQLEIVPADDQSDPTKAVSEALRLTQVNKIDYMVGPQLSQVAAAVGPTLNAAGIMWVTTTTAAERLTTQFVPRHFSTLYASAVQAFAFANAIQAGKYKSVAIISDDGSSSLGMTSALKERLKEKGIQVTEEKLWHSGDTDMTPQMLALRRGNPDLLFLAASIGKDGGFALKSVEEIGWRVPTMGSGAFNVQPVQVTEVSGPEPLKRLTALVYAGMSACPGDPLGQTGYAQLLVKVRKAEPVNYDKLSLQNVASGYDWIYILKYAATGAGSLNGDKMTAWMEQNASSMKVIYSPFRASKTDHFLLGPESLIPGTDVGNPRADGTTKRLGC